MPIVFCEMMRTMGVSGAMAVSSVQSTCYNEPILRVRGSQISMGPCHARMLSHITDCHTKTRSYIHSSLDSKNGAVRSVDTWCFLGEKHKNLDIILLFKEFNWPFH